MKPATLIAHYYAYSHPIIGRRKAAKIRINRFLRNGDFSELVAYVAISHRIDDMLIAERCAKRAVGLDDKDAA
jgi:hypothetical protein